MGNAIIDKSFAIDDDYGTTPSGIFLDLIPYVLMVIFGISGLLWIKSFKRI